MYEPVILRKKQPRSVAGTPAGKFSLITTLTKGVITLTAIVLFSYCFAKKKEVIAELNEYEHWTRKLTVLEELEWTKKYWNQAYLQNVTAEVFQRYRDKNKLHEVGSGISVSELQSELD